MKFKIQDIRDLSDSREILESKPNKFTTLFIYIVLTLIGISFIWCWFSEKEIIIKARGIVRPNQDIYKVSNMLTSKIISINFQNGSEVKKDDIIYTLDSSELIPQKESLEKKINTINLELQNLEKLKDSITDNTNYFNQNDDNEKDYYEKYENYKKNNTISLSEWESLTYNKNYLTSKIDSLNLLKKSIAEDKNNLPKDSLYYDEFNSYIISKNEITNKISQSQKIYDDLKSNPDKNKNELLKLTSDIDTFKVELQKLKNDYNIKVNSNIEDLNTKIKDLENNLDKISDTNAQSKDKNKSTTLIQVADTIKANKEKLLELEDTLKSIISNIDKCTVKAPNDGVLDYQSDLKIGDVMQAGFTPINILPKQSKYKIELLIGDKDIANVKENSTVKYSFPSLPYKEYGFLNGTLSKISVDSKINSETGLAYYSGESTIDDSTVYSHKGELSEIKNGMTCEAQIVTRKEKMLYYILEKLNLKND